VHLNWRTPHQEIQGEKPDITTLQVFGCGAYVYLPKEKQKNKLTPRSESMTYIGVEDGVKGVRFIRASGAIFLGVTATFDETLFPRCKGAKTPLIPPLEEVDHNHHSDGSGDDSDDDVADYYHQPPAYPSEHRSSDQHDHGDRDTESEQSARDDAANNVPPIEQPVSPKDFEPRRQDQREWNDLPARRSSRNRTIPKCPGNIYGETCAPLDIARDIEHEWYWKKTVGQDSTSY
jgi:hypothetical protein